MSVPITPQSEHQNIITVGDLIEQLEKYDKSDYCFCYDENMGTLKVLDVEKTCTGVWLNLKINTSLGRFQRVSE